MTMQPRPLAPSPSLERSDESLRFDRVLLEVSAGFITVSPRRFDDAIDRGLRLIVESLDIDRSTLSLMSTLNGRIEVANSYAVPGVELAPRLASAPMLWPWGWSRLTADMPVVFACLDDLPPEASFDRDNYVKYGLKSHVAMPMIVRGKLYGCLGFGCMRRERTWPEPLLGQMRRIAEIFGNALAQKYAQEELDRALEFQRLATRILASIFLEPGSGEGSIRRGLGEIGRFLRVEQMGLWERAPRSGRFRQACGWQADEGGPRADTTWILGLDWLTRRLIRGETVREGREFGLSAEAATSASGLETAGVRSFLAVPVVANESVVGALYIGSMHEDRIWPEYMIPGVTLLAEVFASVSARLSAESRKQAAEVEAAQWRERLAHLVRVHTAGEMSAALAHEITQPLGAIENYALAARRRMREPVPDLYRVLELLDKLVGQTTRAGDVISKMRSMVRRHELDPKEIDIGHAVRDCLDLVSMDCNLRDIRLELMLTKALPHVVADEIHVQQVLLNLLRNAIESMERGGTDGAKTIVVSVGTNGVDGVVVGVADSGPGIADGDLERVFESFYSTKPNGLGIGLAICRKLMEAHGGTLIAAHRDGGGAVFTLTLPVAAPATPAP